jgi:DNA-binding response OmpR family regulator
MMIITLTGVRLQIQGPFCIKLKPEKLLTVPITEVLAMDLNLPEMGLPDVDGLEVIRRIREWSHAPIIVISARGKDTEKVEDLDAGADDYLAKPFSVEELSARAGGHPSPHASPGKG